MALMESNVIRKVCFSNSAFLLIKKDKLFEKGGQALVAKS